MSTSHIGDSSSGCLLSLSAALNRTKTVESAVDRTTELAIAAFESPTVSVYEYNPATEAFGAVCASGTPPPTDAHTRTIPKSIRTQIRTRSDDPSVAADTDATIDADPQEPLRAEAFAPAGSRWVLHLSVTESEEFDETGVEIIEGIAANLGVALDRIDDRREQRAGVEPQELLNEGPLLFVRTRQVDDEAIIDACSDRFLRRLGYDRGELAGEPLASVYTADSAADLRDGGYDDALAGSFEVTERTLVDADGEPVHTLLRAVPRRDGVAGTNALFVDVTERERQRRELQERSHELESFRRAVEEAADGVAILEDGEYTYVDRTHVDMYGFDSTDDLLGDTWRRLYDDEEVARLEREAFPTLEADGHWRGSVTGSRPDGSTFPAELSLTIVGDGRLVCTVRDETERKARERELELKERAMDEASVGIQITDPDREDNPLVYVNEGFERMTGYAREEVLGHNPRFLQGEAADPETVARLRGAIEAEDPVSLDVRNERKDGSPYWSRLSVTPVTDESGAVRSYIGIQQDITERKRRQKRTESRNDLLTRIYEVTTDPGLTFDEKITALLRAGRDHLDLPYGFLTRIDQGEHGASDAQTMVEAVGSHDRLQPGESDPLERSYCRKTVENDGPLTLTHAVEEGWADDPAHETFGLEAYIGSEVVAGDDLYGTLCFASMEPRDRSFDEFERSFIRLVGRWVGYEIDRRETQAELREQRERLELALSGTNTGLAEWDLETDAVTWNETLIEILGREIESAEEFRAAVHPDDRDRVKRELEAMLETGTPWTGEFRMLDGDGDTLWIGSRATPVYDGGGEPVRVLATGTDISDRKEAERERRRSERQYRRLAQNIPNGAVISFDEDLNYRVAAGELLPAFGVDPSDVSGAAVGSLLPDAGVTDDLLPRFRAALDGERTDRRVELGDRTVRVHIVPINDSGGQSVETRGLLLAQDVTAEARRERELYEEREQFRLLTESVDEYAFFIVDEEGVIQTWNDGTVDTFGHDAEAAVGTSIAELHPAADRESGLPSRLLQQARIAGESAHEGWRVRADGSEFYADVRHAPLETDDSEFRGYAVIVRDMTERRRQRRRTERFVEESDDVITIVDPDGTVTYASGSATRVLGHDPDDLVGENLFDYFHADGREAAMRTFFAGVDDPGGSFQAECRFRSGDDGWLNIERQCRNMLDDDAIDGMLLYLRDVTERTERARRFESIFNQAFQFTALLEPDGTVLEVNDAALEFGGIERDAIAGTRLGDARWWTHSEAVRDNVVDAIDRAADGEFVRYETEVRGADGLATIDFSLKPVTDEDDDVSLLVAEGRDITSREQHRRHLEVMQRVVRHNLRNDLTKVRGWAQLIADEDNADERAEKLETIEGIVDKWVAMSEKMRNIGQLLEGQRTHSRTAECETIVRDAVESVRDKHDGGTIRMETAEGGSARVPTTVRNAVHELMENAVQAGDDATVAVDLARPDEDWIEVRVSDDGPGIPEMEAEVLETGEETPLTHGLGLGLWMVRMVVTQAGGTVSVESSDGGTEVRLRLPATRRERAQAGTGTPE